MNNCDTDISGDCPVRHSPVFRRSVFYYIGTTSDPATGLIFTKPQNSSGAARVALPQTAVAIVWRRSAFGYNDGRPPFANRVVATGLNGQFRLIPYGSVFSTRYTFDFGRIRRRRLLESNATRYQDYVGQASRRYRFAFDVRSFPIDEHASSGVCWRSSRPLIFGFPDGGRHGGSWFKENISDE